MKNYLPDNSVPKNTLTRACLKESLHNKLSILKEDTNQILESIIKELSHGIIHEKYVKIFSFGTFLIHNKKKRIGRNPKTKKEAVISARKSVSFRPSERLRKIVNENYSGTKC